MQVHSQKALINRIECFDKPFEIIKSKKKRAIRWESGSRKKKESLFLSSFSFNVS